MKRKLFTLLAALMVLASFQMNAQTAPYDGMSPHWLNIWKANYTGGFTDPSSTPANAVESAEDYPISADVAVNATATGMQSIIANAAGFFTRQQQLGALGQLESYFYLTAVGGNPNLYQIKAKNGNAPFTFPATEGSKAGQTIMNFEFVRFYDAAGVEYPGPTPSPVVGFIPAKSQSVPAQTGGYLSAESNATGSNDRTRYVLVYDVTIKTGQTQPTNVYAMVSMDSIRRNWNLIQTNKLLAAQRLVPVWVKADPIGGRWANQADFDKVGEFIKFKTTNGTDLQFKDGNTSVNTFSVKKDGALDFGTGSNQNVFTTNTDPMILPHTSIAGDNPGGTDHSRLTANGANWELQYFTITDPKTCKYLTAMKTNILGGQAMGSGVFGDDLQLNGALTGNLNAERTQRFAVWINDNGEMELYPLNAYTCDYQTGTFPGGSPGFNSAVWFDKPRVTASTYPFKGQDFNNAAFKLGTYSANGANVLSLTDNRVGSAYKDLPTNPAPADLINLIEEGRYFFLEVRPPNGNLTARTSATTSTQLKDERYVLDVATSWDAGLSKPIKHLVVTPMEKNRYTGTAGRYFDTPYDSVNMSAHWKIVKVYSKEYDPATANNHLIGYRFVNQMGDTLQYAYNTAVGAVPLNNMLTTGYESYFSNENGTAIMGPSKTTNVLDQTIVGTNVWQTIHFAQDGYFSLRNLRYAGVANNFAKPIGGNMYLDTIKTTTDFGASKAYWYAGERGRQATTTGDYAWTQHLQKDVYTAQNITCGTGLQLKISDIDYEYAKGGDVDSQTNHSNDGYFPEDDSLCVYLYKQGNYDIIEALSHTLRLEGNYTGPDPVYGKFLASMGMASTENPFLDVEPVDTAAYLSPKTYVDSLNVTQLNVDYRLDNYKWHYIKNKEEKYLVYDTINTTTSFVDQKYGFRFKAVDKENATAFRFYQPLVEDKHLENYIMEFRVAKHTYEVNRTLSVSIVDERDEEVHMDDNYGVNSLYQPAVTDVDAPNALPLNPQYATYTTLVATVQAYVTAGTHFNAWDTTDQREYKEYLAFEHRARTKYAVLTTGSDLLLATWNDGSNKVAGAPTAATRFKFRGQDETQCKREYVDSRYLLDNGMYSLPLEAEEWNARDGEGSGNYMTSNADSFAVDDKPTANISIILADTLKVGSAAGKGYISMFKDMSVAHTDTWNDDYRTYNNTRAVELYYVRRGDKYLTVDTTSVYNQSFGQTLDGVSGVKLRWADKFANNSQVGSSVGETTDYRPLQMFAIYGCKSVNPDTNGTFIFIPAASWNVKYAAPFTQQYIEANKNIGNGTVVDEFRIGYYGRDAQLVVQPSSTTPNQGVVATEYMFVRSDYYNGNFCDHNFIQTVTTTKTYITAAADAKDNKANYYNPSMHWMVKKKANSDNIYMFSPEKNVDEDGLPLPVQSNLISEYYLILKSASTSSFGGAIQTFEAINVNDPKQVTTITISCITEKTGDACISKFKEFAPEELTTDWGIIESILSDRYIYSKGKEDGSMYSVDTTFSTPSKWGGSADAFITNVNNDDAGKDGVQYLKVLKSNTDTIASHHIIPYYNIIHVTVDANGKETWHYLEMTKDSVKFRGLSEREDSVIQWSVGSAYRDTMQNFKFCFPFTKDGNGKDSSTYNGGKYANVSIRTMPIAGVIQYLAIDKHNTTRLYADPSQGGVFYFGAQMQGDDEWVGTTSKTGWLKDISRPSVYVVTPSKADPVNYGLLSYHADVLPVNLAKYEFEFIYDTIVGTYNPKPIWYYKIKNSEGKYLTAALSDAAANYKYAEGNNTPYAYFTDKITDLDAMGADKKYVQTFGLKYNKKRAVADHEFPFWVVAQVPSGAYKYLGQINSRMVFFDAGSSSKEIAQGKAMTFEVGNLTDGGIFTDIKDANSNVVTIYGIQGAVKVLNAAGVIEIYTIDGRLFKSVTATGAEQTIAAPRGVVIVKNGTNVEKVIVK